MLRVGHLILRQFWQEFANKSLPNLKLTKTIPKDLIQGPNTSPKDHPRTPNGFQMTSQIALKSTSGAPRAPSGAAKDADVAP